MPEIENILKSIGIMGNVRVGFPEFPVQHVSPCDGSIGLLHDDMMGDLLPGDKGGDIAVPVFKHQLMDEIILTEADISMTGDMVPPLHDGMNHFGMFLTGHEAFHHGTGEYHGCSENVVKFLLQ